MSEIESSAPVQPDAEGEYIIYQHGERVTPRPVGRPPKPKPVEVSFHDRMKEFVADQGIILTNEEFAKVWRRYCELRDLHGAEGLSTYWFWPCPGCRDTDGQRCIDNGKHRLDCNGVNGVVEILWPGDVVYSVAEAKGITNVNLQPAQAARRKLKFWNTAESKIERRKELTAAVEWLKQLDCKYPGYPEQRSMRERVLAYLGLYAIVGVPKVFDDEFEADLAAALATK